MSDTPDRPPRPTFGRLAFFSRRVAALGTAVYFGFYVAGLAHDGRRIPLGDVTRLSRSALWLEVALIALVSFHAASSIGLWIVERTQTARHHRVAFGLALGVALAVALVHVFLLFGRS